MSHGINYLHSHSGLERELKYPKYTVLVDEEFEDDIVYKRNLGNFKFKRFKYGDKTYIEVPIKIFVNSGGIFKNLMN